MRTASLLEVVSLNVTELRLGLEELRGGCEPEMAERLAVRWLRKFLTDAGVLISWWTTMRNATHTRTLPRTAVLLKGRLFVTGAEEVRYAAPRTGWASGA
jgi:hypothetical protein